MTFGSNDVPRLESWLGQNVAGQNDKVKNEHQKDMIIVVLDLTIQIGVAVVSGYLVLYFTRQLFKPHSSSDGTDDAVASSSKQSQIYNRLAKILLKRQSEIDSSTRTSVVTVPTLSAYELTMADDILEPEDIECSFADVGGLDETKREIYELAIVPLLEPDLFKGKLVQPCKGILLYGMPGTGKTMLAKALAKEAEAIFLPLQLSRILNKYWGESNKLIAATFSLAVKLQPSIIFIDELDTFLKNTSDQTAFMDSIKAEFLTLWDGIGTASGSRIMVLGATNKPQNIDSAILRRMPRTFEIPLPDRSGRLSILQLLTNDENLAPSCRTDALPRIADMTVGYSGSDLKELCKAAAMVGIRERTSDFARRRVMGESRSMVTPSSTKDNSDGKELRQSLAKLRPINENDFMIGLEKVKRSGQSAQEYGIESAKEEQRRTLSTTNDQSYAIDVNSVRQLTTLLHTLSYLSKQDHDDNEMPELK
jgi:ATPase family AAA domain-containing protein 1